MRLKRLVLHGYKTFATKTEFQFGAGITAIVGPNGCGKSNIADAIRWVLGEQSYSTLRGRRTTDMIFAGSQTRPRAGMAQAILTLDNSDGWLSLDYAEIEIGRRAYRSGDNEYTLNQQKVRLRDVNDLLADSGLGERTYTIIGQGLVDQALSLRAEERRTLFEEAAGISHYKLKRSETLRHLEETHHNLERVYDIIAEIEPRLRSLKRQSNRARNYEHVAADLRHYLRIWFGYQWDQARRALRKARLESTNAQQSWDEGRRAQLTVQQEIETLRRESAELVQTIQSGEDDREALRSALEQANRNRAILAERLAFSQRRIAEIREDLPRLEIQKQEALKQLEKAIGELNSATQQLEESEDVLTRFEQRVRSKQESIEKWEFTVTDLESQQIDQSAQLNQVSGMLDQLRERLEATEGELISDSVLDEAESHIDKHQESVNTILERINQEGRIREDLEQERGRIEAEIQTLQAQLTDLEDRTLELQLELTKKETRARYLDESMAAGQIDLSEFSTIIGTFEEKIEIPSEYESAIRAALASRIKTLLVRGRSELWELAAQLSNHHFIADIDNTVKSSEIETPEGEFVIGWASDLVKVKGPASNLVKPILGHVLVLSSDRKQAYDIASELPPGLSAVTLDGTLVHSGGLIETTRPAPDTNVESDRELEQIYQEADKIQTLLDRSNEDSAQAQGKLGMLRVSLDEVDAAINMQKDLIIQSDKELLKSNHALILARDHFESLTEKQNLQLNEISILEERIRNSEKRIEDLEVTKIRVENSMELARLELERLPSSEINEERKRHEQSMSSAQTIVAGRQAVVDSRQATLDQIVDQLDRQHERLSDLRSKKIDLELDERQAEVERLQNQLDTLKQKLEPLQNSHRQKQSKISDLEQRLSEQMVQNQEAENHYFQSRLAFNQAENRLSGLRERISSDLGLVNLPYDADETAQSPLPIDEVVDQLPIVVELPDDIEKTIQRFRSQLHRMGGINPDAPAEYEETRKRHEFLQQQITDLTSTIEQLNAVIAELDELTSKTFAETVERVDKNFGEIFRRLFGGGSARLVLTDPEDLTTSGVEIVARLPNRREQALGLLSGGERSLTATALIFALLKVSPTPFCVLDEVDAMLDEANINRFREMLQELCEETQFIIITHNRGTVRVAENVYGVSMGADSASQVISIKPEDYVSMANIR